MPKKGQFSSHASKDSIRQRAYNSTPTQIHRRAQRNSARREMEQAGRVHKGDNRDVDHKDMNTAHNSLSNLRVQSEHKNRARNRGHGGRPRGS